ncbi:dephospho-CoA kinase [Aureimonas sp. AU4]|uniref:dephospho-CoA kinase n=1 Tax=Aureimonas sp. AU4 TaxID=1638163 RepID=UPI00078061D8|nr:dephospho-CoA kinase [Aureimonas sp. AU4]
MIRLGLTGSIGMGKSTTAAMFRDEGLPVHDADATVHRLYRGRAAPLVEALFPGVLDGTGAVDRARLGSRVLGDPTALKRLEALIHPMVREEEAAFLREAEAAGAPAAVLDIPLLFETGGERRVDRVVVVSAPEAVQRERVMARPGMTAARFDAILAQQMPDAEKRRRADFVVETGEGLDHARTQVAAIVRQLREPARPEPGPA